MNTEQNDKEDKDIGEYSEWKTDERLKQIQNIAKICMEELDIFLQLHFFQKYGNDLTKIAEALIEYQGVIENAFEKNHKRGYMIWVNLKGLAFTLIYILTKVQNSFQIDILSKIEEIKALLFNQFWAPEIQQCEEFLILKLCMILLIFSRKATSIAEIIFEFEKYESFIQEIFENRVRRDHYDCSSLYLFKIYTASAFAMQYKKYDIKLRERVFDQGQQVFAHIWENQINESYIYDEREKLKCVHCYFEFTYKHIKLLYSLLNVSKMKQFQSLLQESFQQLQVLGQYLSKDYAFKLKNRLQSYKDKLTQSIQQQTLKEDYFQDQIKANEEEQEQLQEEQYKKIKEKKKFVLGKQSQVGAANDQETKLQKAKSIEANLIDTEEQEDDIAEGLDNKNDKIGQKTEEYNVIVTDSKDQVIQKKTISSYIQKFMMNKFSQQPQILNQSNSLPQQMNDLTLKQNPSENLNNITVSTGNFQVRSSTNLQQQQEAGGFEMNLLNPGSNNLQDYKKIKEISPTNKIDEFGKLSYTDQVNLNQNNTKFASTVKKIFENQPGKDNNNINIGLINQVEEGLFSFRVINEASDQPNQLQLQLSKKESSSILRKRLNISVEIGNFGGIQSCKSASISSNQRNRKLKSFSEHQNNYNYATTQSANNKYNKNRCLSFGFSVLNRMNESILSKTLSKKELSYIPSGEIKQHRNTSLDSSGFLRKKGNDLSAKSNKKMSIISSNAAQIYRQPAYSLSTTNSSINNQTILFRRNSPIVNSFISNSHNSNQIYYNALYSATLASHNKNQSSQLLSQQSQNSKENPKQNHKNVELLHLEPKKDSTPSQKLHLSENLALNNLDNANQLNDMDQNTNNEKEKTEGSYSCLPFPAFELSVSQKKTGVMEQQNSQPNDNFERFGEASIIEGISLKKTNSNSQGEAISKLRISGKELKDSQKSIEAEDPHSRKALISSLSLVKRSMLSSQLLSSSVINDKVAQIQNTRPRNLQHSTSINFEDATTSNIIPSQKESSIKHIDPHQNLFQANKISSKMANQMNFTKSIQEPNTTQELPAQPYKFQKEIQAKLSNNPLNLQKNIIEKNLLPFSHSQFKRSSTMTVQQPKSPSPRKIGEKSIFAASGKTKAFQAFLQEEQQKQIDEATGDAQQATKEKKSTHFQEKKQDLQHQNSGEAAIDQSAFMHNLYRKATIASNSSSSQPPIGSNVQFEGGKLRIPLSLVDYDFDQYSQIYKETSPSIVAGQIHNSERGLIQRTSLKKQSHDEQTIIGNGEPISSDFDKMKTLLNFDIETGANKNYYLQFDEIQQFSDAVSNSPRQSISVAQPNYTQRDKNSKEQKDNNNSDSDKDSSSISLSSNSGKFRLKAGTISKLSMITGGSVLKGANNMQTRADDKNNNNNSSNKSMKGGEHIRRLSIQSHQMLSQQQISLASIQDIYSKDENLRGKPQLQNLLSFLELEKQKQGILMEISSSNKTQLKIKDILNKVDIPKTQSTRKVNSYQTFQQPDVYQQRPSRSNSIVSLQNYKLMEESNQSSNDVIVPVHFNKNIPNPIKERQMIQKQRSFFYKQNQEELMNNSQNLSPKHNHDQQSSLNIKTRSDLQSQASIKDKMVRKRESLNKSSSSEDDGEQSSHSLSSTPRRLLELKNQGNFSKINNQEIPNGKTFSHERHQQKKSSQFIVYKTSDSSIHEVIENQPSVSRNNELNEAITVISVSNSPDFTKLSSKKRSNFSEENPIENAIKRNRDRETSIIHDLEIPAENSSISSSVNNDQEEMGESTENIKVEQQKDHQITFFPSKTQIESPGLKNASSFKKMAQGIQGKGQKMKRINSTEEDISKPFNPIFKFVRFVQGKPMVLTVMYQNIASATSGHGKDDTERRQNTIIIKINDQQLFFAWKDGGAGELISEIELEIDSETKQKYLELIKANQKKREKYAQQHSSQNLNQERNIPDDDEEDVMTLWPLLNISFETYLRKTLPKVYTIPQPPPDDDEPEDDIQKRASNQVISDKASQEQSSPPSNPADEFVKPQYVYASNFKAMMGSQKKLGIPPQKKIKSGMSGSSKRRGKSRKVKEIISQYNLFTEKPGNIQDLVSEFDLMNIGSVKDKVNQFVKHYGKRIRNDMGSTFIISKEDQTNQLVLVSLRKSIDKSVRSYSNIVPFYAWDFSLLPLMKAHLYSSPMTEAEKQVQLPNSCLKEPSYRKTENYFILKHTKYLHQKLLNIIQIPPIIFAFLKKDDMQKYHCITVKISFKPGSENIKSSAFSNFSFYVLGKNMKTLMNSIQPLDIHVDEIIENDPSMAYIYKIMSRYTIYDRIPRRWTEFLIYYFNKILVFRSTDKFLRQNYEYKLESIFMIQKKERLYDQNDLRKDKSAKYNSINNSILRNILFKETLKKEDFLTIFDEKYREAFMQYQNQMRFNISDLEELVRLRKKRIITKQRQCYPYVFYFVCFTQLADENQDLKEAEIDFIRRMCKDNEQTKLQGPQVANLREQDKLEKAAEQIIFSYKAQDEKHKFLEMLVHKTADNFQKSHKKDVFCNRYSSSVVILPSDNLRGAYWIVLENHDNQLTLKLTSMSQQQKYIFKVKSMKQKELIMNLFRIKSTLQAGSNNTASSFKQLSPLKNALKFNHQQSQYQSISLRRESLLAGQRQNPIDKQIKFKHSVTSSMAGLTLALHGLASKEAKESKSKLQSTNNSQTLNVQFLRSFFMKNVLADRMTFQGKRLVMSKIREHNLRNHLDIESLNTIKDHLLLCQSELKRFYSSYETYFIRQVKSVGKSIIILKGFRLGNDQQKIIDGQQYLFLVSLTPYFSRTRLYTFVLNHSDLLKLNPQLAENILSKFDYKSMTSLIDLIVNQFSTLKCYLARLPIFTFGTNNTNVFSQNNIQMGNIMSEFFLIYFDSVEKEQVFGQERQISIQIGKKDQKGQKFSPQMSARNIFKKLYNISTGSIRGSMLGSFNNRKRTDQPRQSTLKIRYLANHFYKNEYEISKHSKTTSFLEDSSFKHRIIIQQPKLFGQYWGLITVFKDILGQKWNIRIYIPKTCRTISCKLAYSDFERCSSDFISQSITKKLIFFFENPLFTPFKNFQELHDRAARRSTTDINDFYFQEPSKKQQKEPSQTSIQDEDPSLAGKKAMTKIKKLIRKHWIEFMADSLGGQQKLTAVKKIYRINKFLDMTKELDDSFSMHIADNRQNFILRFVEIETWLRMINVCHFRINHSSIEIYLHFGSAKLPISELVLDSQYKISESNEFYTEIYIDLIKSYYNPQKMKALKENEERKEFTSTKKALLDHYFNTMDYLPYEQTPKFCFHLINYSIKTQTTKTFAISLREILNLYTAEGFSKLHNGQTNSKVTYKDLKEVCAFIIFKIKTQNFLDLALNENAGPHTKQAAEKMNLSKKIQSQNSSISASSQQGQQASKQFTSSSPPHSSSFSIINSIMNNQKNKDNFSRNDKKSRFAPSTDFNDQESTPKSQITLASRNPNRTRSIKIRSQEPQSLEESSKKVNFSIKDQSGQPRLQSSFADQSNKALKSFFKRTDSISSFNDNNPGNSTPISPHSPSDQQNQQDSQSGNNSSEYDDSMLDDSESSQIYIYDSIIDIKNRIMIRTYFYLNDATFVIKLSQCGTGAAFTRFLHFNYFSKKDLLFNQYLKAELYDEIIRRATRYIKRKMYAYFCIQHKMTPNTNLYI